MPGLSQCLLIALGSDIQLIETMRYYCKLKSAVSCCADHTERQTEIERLLVQLARWRYRLFGQLRVIRGSNKLSEPNTPECVQASRYAGLVG